MSDETEPIIYASDLLAEVFGDGMLAMHVGPTLTCSEADKIASALILLDQREAAATLIAGHAIEDDEGDSHVFGDEDAEDAARAYTDTLARSLPKPFGEEEDGAPCCPDPNCDRNPCTFPGYADNH